MESLTTNITLAEICRKYNLKPNEFYSWKQKFIEGGKMAFTDSDENINMQVQKENERMKKLIGELTDPSTQTERGNPHNSAGQIMILDLLSFELCLHMASYTNIFTYLPSCFLFLLLNTSTEAAPTNPAAKIPMNSP
jgi:hypothetical protein